MQEKVLISCIKNSLLSEHAIEDNTIKKITLPSAFTSQEKSQRPYFHPRSNCTCNSKIPAIVWVGHSAQFLSHLNHSFVLISSSSHIRRLEFALSLLSPDSLT